MLWKERMHEERLPMLTQTLDDRARCFCGAEVTTASISKHIWSRHGSLKEINLRPYRTLTLLRPYGPARVEVVLLIVPGVA
jgi:hypothetical protein